MPIDVVIAGLSVAGFDELRKESEKRLAPSGNLFARPVKKPGYPRDAALQYQREVHDRIVALSEATQISLTIAYVDYAGETTKEFIDAFRPFALVRPIEPLKDQSNGRAYREYLVGTGALRATGQLGLWGGKGRGGGADALLGQRTRTEGHHGKCCRPGCHPDGFQRWYGP